MRLLVRAPRGSSSHCWSQPPHCCQPRARRQRPPCRPIRAQPRVTADQWEASPSRTTGSGAVTSYPVTGHSLLGASCRQMEKYRTSGGQLLNCSYGWFTWMMRCLYTLKWWEIMSDSRHQNLLLEVILQNKSWQVINHRKITLKSDSDYGYLILTDTDSIDAFLFSKLFYLIFALSKLNWIFFSISDLWFHVLDILIYKKLCI